MTHRHLISVAFVVLATTGLPWFETSLRAAEIEGPRLTTTATTDAAFLKAIQALDKAYQENVAASKAELQESFRRITDAQDLATQDQMLDKNKTYNVQHRLLHAIHSRSVLERALHAVAYERLRAACRSHASKLKWRQSYDELRKQLDKDVYEMDVWAFLKLAHPIVFTGSIGKNQPSHKFQATAYDYGRVSGVYHSRASDDPGRTIIFFNSAIQAKYDGLHDIHDFRDPILESSNSFLYAGLTRGNTLSKYKLKAGGNVGRAEEVLQKMRVPYADVYFAILTEYHRDGSCDYVYSNALQHLLLSEGFPALDRSYQEKSGLSLEDHAAWEKRGAP